MKKTISLLLTFSLLCMIKANGDSTSLTNRYIFNKSQLIGLHYYGWQSIAFGGGEKTEYFTGGFGALLTYERFLRDRFSVCIGISHLTSFLKSSDFKMNLTTVPVYFKYYPKFFKNLGNFDLTLVNGYQKYTFDIDSFNFENFQTNINFGVSLLLIPKKLFKKRNNHWIGDLNFGIPVYNLTRYPALPSGYFGIKYLIGN